MQDLRRMNSTAGRTELNLLRALIWVWLVLALGSLSQAASLRIATWNMQWFPSGRQVALDPGVEAGNIRQAGELLSRIGADILVLQEVRSGQVADALARECGPDYHTVICSQFKEGGATSWQQIVIVSRIQAVAAWSDDWETVGLTDPPRGFAFAAFDVEGKLVGAYGVHLKSNLRSEDPRTNQLNILKRELAMKQLLQHRERVAKRLGREVGVWVVAGDYNTTLDDVRFASEATLRSLIDAGFSTKYESIDVADRITVPAYKSFPAATFDYILQSGAAWESGAATIQSHLSDHRLVYATITLP